MIRCEVHVAFVMNLRVCSSVQRECDTRMVLVSAEGATHEGV